MPDTIKEEATVTYGVKELLNQMMVAQAQGFAEIKQALIGKADKADVARMESRLDAQGKQLADHALRITKVESVQHDQDLTDGVHAQRDEQHWSWKKRIWAGLGSIGLVAATFWGPYAATHLHF